MGRGWKIVIDSVDCPHNQTGSDYDKGERCNEVCKKGTCPRKYTTKKEYRRVKP